MVLFVRCFLSCFLITTTSLKTHSSDFFWQLDGIKKQQHLTNNTIQFFYKSQEFDKEVRTLSGSVHYLGNRRFSSPFSFPRVYLQFSGFFDSFPGLEVLALYGKQFINVGVCDWIGR